MNEYLAIGLKTIFFLSIILIIIRIMGKRELGELNVFDIIVSFMISEIFSNAIADPHSNIFLALLPIFIIFAVQIFISIILLKHKKMRDIIESKPSIIIEKGTINYEEMKKQRYNINDLLQQVHQQGMDNIENIQYAILENNGNLSIIKKDEAELDYPYPLICDGEYDKHVLNKLNLEVKELSSMLDKQNFNIEDVFIAFLNKKHELIIFSKKNNKVQSHQNNQNRSTYDSSNRDC